MPVGYRIVYKLLLIVFKPFNNLAPEYITCFLSNHIIHLVCSVLKTCLYFVNLVLNILGGWGRAFPIAAPRLWNALPADIKNSPTLAHFKGSLKTHLMKEAFA